MIKTNIKQITALVVSITLSLGGMTVNAATVPKESTVQNVEGKGCGHEHTGGGGIYYVLKNDLGFTDAQIESAKTAGKTAFDLAKEKGKTSDQLKAMIIAQKNKRIDEAIANGKLTKEKGDVIKTKIQAKMQTWDGSLKPKVPR